MFAFRIFMLFCSHNSPFLLLILGTDVEILKIVIYFNCLNNNAKCSKKMCVSEKNLVNTDLRIALSFHGTGIEAKSKEKRVVMTKIK